MFPDVWMKVSRDEEGIGKREGERGNTYEILSLSLSFSLKVLDRDREGERKVTKEKKRNDGK